MKLSPDLHFLLGQRTLKRRIHCVGVGLHGGQKIQLSLVPAAADTGIVFRRTDLPPAQSDIPALWHHVVDTRLCTVIANDRGARVGTIEHLMAALTGAGIDNAVIELDGPEVPVMDGSAAPYLFLIACAGIQDLDQPRRVLQVARTVTVSDGDKQVSLAPANRPTFAATIDFASPAIGRQSRLFQLAEGSFAQELARARTFGFYEEVETLRAMGLARGGSLDNAICIRDHQVMNPGGTHWPDEFVRHKLLDAVGDLALAGATVFGRYEGLKPGHALHNRLLRTLFETPGAVRWSVPTLPRERAIA